MSTVKHPKKKELSLERDRRNTYGENSKSSRRAFAGNSADILDERRTSGEVLRRVRGAVQEDEASDAELLAKTRITDSKRRGFRKQPDTPLGVVLADKLKSKKPR
jgi:hypothetical protein